MIITFSPVRSDATLSLSREGDSLTINGIAFDFSGVTEGATLPVDAVACEAVVAPVTRSDGSIRVSLLLPHAADAPEAVRFPGPLALIDGPADAPGLTLWDGATTAGAIDWSRLLTAEAASDAARGAWRETRSIAKLDLLLALVGAGVISEASAMTPGVPVEFEPLVRTMPNPPQSEVRIRWAHLVDVPRMHPIILTVQAALGWDNDKVDGLFGWGRDA
ncbi:MAG: hypothetical protein JNN06_01380 [Gemmobacter sp.]|uniref:hypothetical protein n=1 Tax=Gemmobacter sp. TaxID=1898957 RepID=UPI001A3B499A|nr:hypothetical protein [Gemmobacter sp.]MBL8560906.1 hypothetical protein [Gemmobacter sp.]